MTPSEGSDRSRLVALIMAAVLGIFGLHRFYVGKPGTGLLMLCTLGGLGLWYLYDVILIAAGSFRDGEGRRIVFWSEDDALARPHTGGALTGDVLEDIEALRAEVMDLAERVDFTERLLTRARQQGPVAPELPELRDRPDPLDQNTPGY